VGKDEKAGWAVIFNKKKKKKKNKISAVAR
jgi:hypothetical protein